MQYVLVFELQSTLVISNSQGTDKKDRHSECSRQRGFEITSVGTEKFEITKVPPQMYLEFLQSQITAAKIHENS